MKTLVLGVGNTLLSDEGAGVHALEFLKSRYSIPDTRFLDGGTLSFTLAGAVAEATNLIILDAAEIGMDPGSFRVFEGAELDDYLLSGCRSVHEVGFADLLDVTRLQRDMPENYALIGIQPEAIGWGDRPGEKVREAIPRVAEEAVLLIERWTGTSGRRVVNQ